jgi:hypothetical protein
LNQWITGDTQSIAQRFPAALASFDVGTETSDGSRTHEFQHMVR